MTDPPVLYHAADGVAWITLNRPARLNALDPDLAALLADCAEAAAQDPTLTLVVVRGAGRAFSSGMDRTALANGTIGDAFFRHWIRGLNCLEDMDKITLAVLHGYALGGGLQLALACDLRLASDDAVIGLGATRHGLIPDGAVLRLARAVGLGRALELALLNDEVSPAAACAMGLVNWVCPPGEIDQRLEALIEKSRGVAATATAETKRLLHASFHHDPRSLIEDVIRAQRACTSSPEIVEANQAWQERREPRFYPRRAGTPRART